VDAYSNKLLLIDDDPLFREALMCFLQDMGYTVIEAENGLSGLQLLKKNQDIDLVLVDLVMPVMDGFTFISTARESFPDIPIVALSGIGILEKAIEATRLGAWDFVNKPVENLELLHIIIDRNIEKYLTLKSNKEYKLFLENLAKMRSEQLDKAMSVQNSMRDMLRSDQHVYLKAFKIAPAPAMILQGKDHVIFDVNDAFAKLAGLGSNDLLGVPCNSAGISCWVDHNGNKTGLDGILKQSLRARATCHVGNAPPFQAVVSSAVIDEPGEVYLVLFEI